MAASEELQKKFQNHRRWAADLLLEKEEQINTLTAAVARLNAELEQFRKEPLSAHQEQTIAQHTSTGNSKVLNGLKKDGDACISSKEAGSSDESALPATVPYTEYADVVQKLNLYRRNIQEKDRTLKRVMEKYQKSKAAALAWKQYAAKTYEKSKKRLAATTDMSSEILPFSPIPSPNTALEIGLIPDDMESDTSSIVGILPSQSSTFGSRFGPKANRNRLPQTNTTIGATAQVGENHSQAVDGLQAAVNSVEDDQEKTLGVVCVKEESPGSPDAPNPSPCKIHRTETMDLNNIDNTADTPHRREKVEAFLRRQQAGSPSVILRRVRSNSEPFEEQPLPQFIMESADELLSPRNLLPPLRRADSDPIIKVEEEIYDEFISSDLARRPKPNAANSNQCALPRTHDVSTHKKRKRWNDSRSANMIHAFAEDNDVSKKKRKSERKSTTYATDFNSRLTSLLHQPSPAKHRLLPNQPPSVVTSGANNEMEIDFHSGDDNSSELCKQVCVGNLLQTANEDELKIFFEEFRVKSVSIVSNVTSHPLMFAYVELSSLSEAERAIAKLNGQNFLGRKVSVKPVTSTVCNSGALDTSSAKITVMKHRHKVAPLQTIRATSIKQIEYDNQSPKVVAQNEKPTPNLGKAHTKQVKNTNRTTTNKDKQTVSKESAEASSTFKQPPRPAFRISGQPARQLCPTTPLRKKPVSDLQLSDFKINPSANQGYDYAFVETGRSREGRHQLRGCTDPNCREAAMYTTAPELTSAAPRALTAVSQIDGTPYGVSNEDAQFLREYLGEAFNLETICNMSAAQRDDLVFTARMRIAAKRCGKHKHQYKRHNTPPGFWRTDMPTTQELEHDREEARRLERQKVEERWKEAMREGGLWLFRDES